MTTTSITRVFDEPVPFSRHVGEDEQPEGTDRVDYFTVDGPERPGFHGPSYRLWGYSFVPSFFPSPESMEQMCGRCPEVDETVKVLRGRTEAKICLQWGRGRFGGK